ncbi:MAG: 4Fe-4S dicluster domain-containing protein [Theionarchaea archaeon]|nr:4Fe-4S dicluster domain-containing protein [Theionarchaea archaeon]
MVEKSILDSDMDIYEKLRQKMSIWIVHVEKTPELMEILKLLFTPEEAEFLTSDVFTAPFQDYRTADEIAQCTGKTREEVEKIIDSLEEKRLIFKYIDEQADEVLYSLLPLEYGSIAYISLVQKPEKRDKLLSLFQKISTGEITMGSGVTEYPWGRIIPVEESVIVVNQILPFAKVEEIMMNARSIAVVYCFCRSQNPCGHPLETCTGFNEGADFMVSGGFGRYINLEEALNLLKETEEAGLVHTAVYSRRGIIYMCNCCTCACPILRRLRDSENPRELSSSGFIPEINREKCVLCGKCIEICPLGARFLYSDNENPERVDVNARQCVGCGQCASHCSEGATVLVAFEG